MRTASERKQIANIILQQLGGNKFLVMTGAKNLLFTESGLRFNLPAFHSDKPINLVDVVLSADDDYTLKFYWRSKLIEVVEGVYCDMLQETFTRVTGLDTHL